MVAQLDSAYISLRPLNAIKRLISHFLFQGRPLTTRGRWLNRIVFAQYSVAKRMRQLKEIDKPIFILGTGRSGTTILGKVLSMHPDILFLNEPKALWYSINPRDDVIGSYTNVHGSYRLESRDVTPSVWESAHRLYGYCLAVTGTTRILDKYPEMIFRVSFLQSIFPDARFLFLIRNGWDTIQSISKWSQQEGELVGDELRDWWGSDRRKWNLLNKDIVANDPSMAEIQHEIASFTDHMDMAAVEWVVTMREGIRLLKTNPQNIFAIHYEELVQSSHKTLQDVMKFCGLPEDEKMIQYAKRVLQVRPTKSTVILHPLIHEIFTEMVAEVQNSDWIN